MIDENAMGKWNVYMCEEPVDITAGGIAKELDKISKASDTLN